MDLERHRIHPEQSILGALEKINRLSKDLILFVTEEDGTLRGTLTDGDIRRALVARSPLTQPIRSIMHTAFRYQAVKARNVKEFARLRSEGIFYLPLVDDEMRLVRVINLVKNRSDLPLRALIMAGGEGRRLRPITERIPKPLVEVGGKAIIQYNIEHLVRFGIKDITLSIRYLGDLIKQRFGNGRDLDCRLDYLEEKEAMGTISALGQLSSEGTDPVLVMNSDLLTNIDLESFYLDFVSRGAAMAVATVPYRVKVPYAVLALEGEKVARFEEKPEYLYNCNSGIYLVDERAVARVPKEGPFNATDLMEGLIAEGEKVVSFPLRSYWLDIGKPDDLAKAGEDVHHLRF